MQGQRGAVQSPGQRQPICWGPRTQSDPTGEDAALKPEQNTRQTVSPRTHSRFCQVARVALGWRLVPVMLGVCGYSDKSWCILHGIKILRLFIFITGLSFCRLHTPCWCKGFEMLRCCWSPLEPIERESVPRACPLPTVSPSTLAPFTACPLLSAPLHDKWMPYQFPAPKSKDVPRQCVSSSPIQAT